MATYPEVEKGITGEKAAAFFCSKINTKFNCMKYVYA